MRSNRIFISVLLVFLFFIPTTVISQINYGTTGLMNNAYSRYAEGQNFHGWR